MLTLGTTEHHHADEWSGQNSHRQGSVPIDVSEDSGDFTAPLT